MDKRKILWADDQIEELRSQIVFLESKGFEVVGVSNGDDALDLLRRESFDAVLLDEMMPGRGGLETLVGIRELGSSSPVIMITKSEEEELMERALGRRISDYLVKPVNPTQILMALKRALDEDRITERQVTHDYLRSFSELARQRMEACSWADWADIYDQMVGWELELHRLKDPGLADTHTQQMRDANAEFCRFVEGNYPSWIAGDDGPVMSHQVLAHAVAPHLRDGKRVFLFVLDCMRLDQWRTMEPLLEPWFEVSRELYCSILPTATPFARNAIFAGALPVDIARAHPQWWRGSAREEKSKNAHEKQLLAGQLQRLGLRQVRSKYFKTFKISDTEAMRRQIPSLGDVNLVAAVVNFLDILAHGRSHNDLLQELAPDESAFRSVMQSWFQHSTLLAILKDLAAQSDAVVIVTTDHGSVQVRKASLVKANRDASTNVRYKYGDNLTVDPKEAFVMKKPTHYGLPSDSPIQNYICAKEYNYFVYPTNYHEYERQYKDSFQHGGVSLEEMIVPVATLVPR
jgi:CheY-like chemotaxis protein